MRPRISKFIISLIVSTSAALVYVHQQTELVKMSYAIDYKEKNLERLLDRKEVLGYNVKALESPSRLERALAAQKIDIAFPKRGQIIKVAGLSPNTGAREHIRSVQLESRPKIFGTLELFGLSQEAQAKEK